MNKKPNEPLPPLVKEFIKFVLSKEGQEVVIKDGYGPLPTAVHRQAAEADRVGDVLSRSGHGGTVAAAAGRVTRRAVVHRSERECCDESSMSSIRESRRPP